MRRSFLPLLLALSLLAACGQTGAGPAPASASAAPPAPSSLPTELETVAGAWGPGLHLVAQVPQAEVALYAPLDEEMFRGVLLRRGERQWELDWPLSQYLLHVAWADYDGDGEQELAVGNPTAHGNLIAYEDLHILEFLPDGGMEDFQMPEELFREVILSDLKVAAKPEEARLAVQLGEQASVVFSPFPGFPEAFEETELSYTVGEERSYLFEDNSITGIYGIQVFLGKGLPDKTAYVEAAIYYADGQFQLEPAKLGVFLLETGSGQETGG